jgi:hypothetical protein
MPNLCPGQARGKPESGADDRLLDPAASMKSRHSSGVVESMGVPRYLPSEGHVGKKDFRPRKGVGKFPNLVNLLPDMPVCIDDF